MPCSLPDNTIGNRVRIFTGAALSSLPVKSFGVLKREGYFDERTKLLEAEKVFGALIRSTRPGTSDQRN